MKICYITLNPLGEFMAKAAKKEQAKPKKLSKIAKWWLKHPEGSGLIIHDMKAVLRQYDTLGRYA